MKANELMIGDWVQIDAPDKYAGAKGTIHSLIHHRSDDGAYFHVFVQDMGIVMREVFNEDLRPIPLTAEILEKNGFERRKLDGGAEEFVLTDDYYDITIEEWSDSIWVVRYDCTEMSTPHEQAVCGYVHQLQHFFRLSAPDELADNFKV